MGLLPRIFPIIYLCAPIYPAKQKILSYLIISFFVSVEKPQLKTARSKKVSEGSELKLKCKVTNRALPPPAISWYKDGALLTHNIDTKK